MIFTFQKGCHLIISITNLRSQYPAAKGATASIHMMPFTNRGGTHIFPNNSLASFLETVGGGGQLSSRHGKPGVLILGD